MWHITNLKYIFRNHLLERRYHPRNTANKWDKKLTIPPLEIRPPNKRSIESDTAVESRRKTEFTFTFSLKTNHGYGILGSRAFTEFYEKKEMQSTIKEKKRKENLVAKENLILYNSEFNDGICIITLYGTAKQLTEYRRTWPSSIVFNDIDFSLFCKHTLML